MYRGSFGSSSLGWNGFLHLVDRFRLTGLVDHTDFVIMVRSHKGVASRLNEWVILRECFEVVWVLMRFL